MATTEKRYYCSFPEAPNEVHGPFNLMEMAGLLKAKQVTAQTLTCREGEEEWKPFQERPDYHYATEIPAQAITDYMHKRHEEGGSFSARKLLYLAWYLCPLILLYLAYRCVRLYLTYHIAHSGDASQDPNTP